MHGHIYTGADITTLCIHITIPIFHCTCTYVWTSWISYIHVHWLTLYSLANTLLLFDWVKRGERACIHCYLCMQPYCSCTNQIEPYSHKLYYYLYAGKVSSHAVYCRCPHCIQGKCVVLFFTLVLLTAKLSSQEIYKDHKSNYLSSVTQRRKRLTLPYIPSLYLMLEL